jgi:transcriptional regulator with XRE-family HTH domain
MIAEKLKEYRLKGNWSQDDLAKKMNVSRSLVAKWEQGRSNPTADDLDKLAELFAIKPEELASYKDLKGIYKTEETKSKKKLKVVLISASAVVVSLIVGVAIWASIVSSQRIEKVSFSKRDGATIQNVTMADDSISQISFSDGTVIKSADFEKIPVKLSFFSFSSPYNETRLSLIASELQGFRGTFDLETKEILVYSGFHRLVSKSVTVTSVALSDITLLWENAVKGFAIDFAHTSVNGSFDGTGSEVFSYELATYKSATTISGGAEPFYQYGPVTASWKTRENGLEYWQYDLPIALDIPKYAKKMSSTAGVNIFPASYLKTEISYVTSVDGTGLFGSNAPANLSCAYEESKQAIESTSTNVMPYRAYEKHFRWDENRQSSWLLVGFNVSLDYRESAASYLVSQFDKNGTLLGATALSSLSEVTSFKKSSELDYTVIEETTFSGIKSRTLVTAGSSFTTSFSDDYGLFPVQHLSF